MSPPPPLPPPPPPTPLPQELRYKYLRDDVEELSRYSPGGYYPADIDDVLHGGRYRITHKLGYGTYSTVWLARDLHLGRFVSLKFLVASTPSDTAETLILRHLSAAADDTHPGRPYVLTLLDEFSVHSANGTHRCIVTEALGPSIAAVKYDSDSNRLPGPIARTVASQCAKGVSYLHSRGIVHGDLHKANILFRIPNLSSWSIEEVRTRFGPPRLDEIRRIDGLPNAPYAPKYAVRPPNPLNLVPFCLSGAVSIQIADFGESFFADREPPEELNTPVALSAPEILFGGSLGPPVDVWALAGTLFEVLGDHRLFESFMADREEVLVEMVRLLGRFPERWWGKWEERGAWFEEDGRWKVAGERTVELEERVKEIVRDGGGEEFADWEREAVVRVLKGMLRYEPGERVSAGEVVQGLPAAWETAESAA